jgi:hypothetical protein
MDGETDSFVLRSESGTSVAIPYTQKSVLGLGLNSFLLEGDMRSFSLPMWDPYRSHSTTTVFLRPTLELDQTTVAVRDCENKLANAIAGVRAGDKEQLKVFERCMVVLKYPYKKFPIPGGDSYYGFLGNASNRIIGWSLDGTSSDSVWCQMDGMPNECLLFKAEKGIPTYYPPSKNGKDLRQMEFLRAEKDGTLLVHHFPYEIVYFQTYAKFDPAAFEDVTEVVQYFGGSFAAPDEPRSLTFYPRGEAIKFIIGGGLLEEGYIATTTLSFDGKLIGSFETAQTQAFEEGDYFPDTTDLRAYALQSDKTKFYFTAGGTRYTLDLTPAVPKLLKR